MQEGLSSSPCEVEALKKCLEREKGDRRKCEKEIAAFQMTCGKPAKPE